MEWRVSCCHFLGLTRWKKLNEISPFFLVGRERIGCALLAFCVRWWRHGRPWLDWAALSSTCLNLVFVCVCVQTRQSLYHFAVVVAILYFIHMTIQSDFEFVFFLEMSWAIGLGLSAGRKLKQTHTQVVTPPSVCVCVCRCTFWRIRLWGPQLDYLL
jgi:hypothetical protein